MKVYPLMDAVIMHLFNDESLKEWFAVNEFPPCSFYRECCGPGHAPGSEEAPFVYLTPEAATPADWANAADGGLEAKALGVRVVVGLKDAAPQTPPVADHGRVYLCGRGPVLEDITRRIIFSIARYCDTVGVQLDSAQSEFITTDDWPLIYTDTPLAFSAILSL